MNEQFDNTNRGAIWKNDKKEADKHPDFTGSLNVGGKDYWISAWKRKEGAADKAPALSFSVTEKETVAKQGVAQAKDAAGDAPFTDDDIPF